jgi:hypothetical protein
MPNVLIIAAAAIGALNVRLLTPIIRAFFGFEKRC